MIFIVIWYLFLYLDCKSLNQYRSVYCWMADTYVWQYYPNLAYAFSSKYVYLKELDRFDENSSNYATVF